MGAADRRRAAVPVGRHRAAAGGDSLTAATEVDCVRGSVEQAVVTNAMERGWEKVGQDASDEPVGSERHEPRLGGAVTAIFLVAKRDAGLVEGEQPLVPDGDAMGLGNPVAPHPAMPLARAVVDALTQLADRAG